MIQYVFLAEEGKSGGGFSRRDEIRITQTKQRGGMIYYPHPSRSKRAYMFHVPWHIAYSPVQSSPVMPEQVLVHMCVPSSI